MYCNSASGNSPTRGTYWGSVMWTSPQTILTLSCCLFKLFLSFITGSCTLFFGSLFPLLFSFVFLFYLRYVFFCFPEFSFCFPFNLLHLQNANLEKNSARPRLKSTLVKSPKDLLADPYCPFEGNSDWFSGMMMLTNISIT